MITSMQNLINKVPSKFYADLLCDTVSVNAISKSISDENIAVLPNISGFVFRLWNGRQWYEIADPNLKSLNEKVEKLLTKVEFRDEIKLIEYPKHSINKEFPMEKSISEIPLDEKLERVREIFDEMKKIDDRVINPRVAYSDNLLERVFVNTEGSELRQVIPRTRIFLMPIIKDGNKIDYDYHIINSEIGYEALDSITQDTIADIVQSSIDLTNAPSAPNGVMPVILDSGMSGIIAHESMGHGLEADQIIRERSYLKPYYKKKVANDIVNISDSPKHLGAVGSYEFDEEGIIAKKTHLIENGVFTHYLHSRLTASILGEEPHGNGRRQNYLCPVYPRMSNTYFEPGSHTMEELLEGIKEGVMLVKGSSGMEDPLGGGMQNTSRKGYLIKNGEKAGLIKGITLSGSVLEFLSNIDAISKGELKLDGGTCGKGSEDFVPVTDGGTWLRSQGIVSPS